MVERQGNWRGWRDFFAARSERPTRLFVFGRRLIVTWRLLMVAAAIVVLIDHRHALRDLGISPGTAWRRWMVYSRTAENLVSQPRRRPAVHLATR